MTAHFTNHEFDKVGIAVRGAGGVFDWGRYDGVKAVQASRFNLLTRHNDDPGRANAFATRHVVLSPETFGAFKVPGLRNVALTAPYMHDGSDATLRDVVRHYSRPPAALHASDMSWRGNLYLVCRPDIVNIHMYSASPWRHNNSAFAMQLCVWPTAIRSA